MTNDSILYHRERARHHELIALAIECGIYDATQNAWLSTSDLAQVTGYTVDHLRDRCILMWRKRILQRKRSPLPETGGNLFLYRWDPTA